MKMEECQEIARQAVRATLAPLPPWPKSYDEEIVLGAHLDDAHWVFELYLPRPRPEDAVVLVEATVNRATGEVRTTAYPERWTPAS